MGQGITMQWDKQQIQVDAYGDGIIRICELKNGKQPYSAAVELTVEQQQKVAVAQYQVSEQGASTVFDYCGQKWNRMEQLLFTIRKITRS